MTQVRGKESWRDEVTEEEGEEGEEELERESGGIGERESGDVCTETCDSCKSGRKN